MKRKLFILACLVFPLASCSPVEEEKPTEEEIKLENLGKEEVEVDRSEIDNFLTKARESYTLEANEKEIVNRVDGTNILTNEYKYKVENVSGDDARIKETVSYTSSGELYTTSLDYVKDSSGYVAEELLNYDNTIIDKAVGSTIYEVEFANPFSLISSEDLIANNDYFELNSRKNDIFSKYLLGINYELDSVKFYFNNKEIEKITLSAVPFETTFEDKNIGEYIKVNVLYETEVKFTNLGSTEIKGKEPLASRNEEKEEALKEALANIGTNFTIIMNEHDRDYEPNHDYDTVWYYNGSDAVYHQQTINDERKFYDLYYKADPEEFGDNKLRYFNYDEENPEWTYEPPKYSSSYNSAPKEYDWFLPKFSSVSPLVFDYVEDEEGAKYVVNNEDVVGYIGNAFLPGAYAISYFTDGGGDKCEITLDSTGAIKEIVVGYTFLDSQGFPLSRDFSMQFVNIGKTTIPEWVEG